MFSSRTMWFNAANFVIAALSITEVATLIPSRFLSVQLAVVALINLWLRTVTVRPVALIPPGDTAPAPVARGGAAPPPGGGAAGRGGKAGPPPPPVVTD